MFRFLVLVFVLNGPDIEPCVVAPGVEIAGELPATVGEFGRDGGQAVPTVEPGDGPNPG